MEEQKTVQIIGLSIAKDFGSLKATELTFDENNLLTVFKGRVGAGKSSLQKALKLTTAGSKTMEDKNLYGDVDLVAQLLDGDMKVFVGCRTNKDGSGLDYFLYTLDADGKKIKEPVIEGKKATPAAYLQNLQTELTWRLNELTSENSTTQRNILLELYSNEMEEKGVIFNKNHPKYVGSIIDKIEKAKNNRSFKDMKRKEVGGIADDLSKKGIDFKSRKTLKPTDKKEKEIETEKAAIAILKQNPETARTSTLNEISLRGSKVNTSLRAKNDEIQKKNKEIQKLWDDYEKDKQEKQNNLDLAKGYLQKIKFKDEFYIQNLFKDIEKNSCAIQVPVEDLLKELKFNDKGGFVVEEIETDDKELKELIKSYSEIALEYLNLKNLPIEEVDTTEKENSLKTLEKELENIQIYNKEVLAVNSFHDWKESNEAVNAFKKDYFNKLTEINTGISGLFIAPEFIINSEGEKLAKDDGEIFLWYNGQHDPEYFYNPNLELRKLSSYSGTQKPMICLLIQEYLLSKKPKALRYLWIDDVPLDLKTRDFLSKMSSELDLHLFVNWTGDFDIENLKDGEILIENGELFLPNS